MKIRCCVAVMLLVVLGELVGTAQTVAIDTQKSKMTVRVYKSGLFSALGHDHEIQAPIESGEIDTTARTVTLTVDARKLTVLDPDLAADKRAQVQKDMHSEKVLDSARFHEIRFQSTTVEGGPDGALTVRGELTLHGQTQPVTMEVRQSNGAYAGRAKLKQTAFGMTPISAGGGTVKVKDEVLVEFEIVPVGSGK
jgi:polyisoprenoid-binding protein YceI